MFTLSLWSITIAIFLMDAFRPRAKELSYAATTVSVKEGGEKIDEIRQALSNYRKGQVHKAKAAAAKAKVTLNRFALLCCLLTFVEWSAAH